MINFTFADVTSILLHDGEWLNVEQGSLESSMIEIAGKQLPVFLFRDSRDGIAYCVPLGSLHAMRWLSS